MKIARIDLSDFLGFETLSLELPERISCFVGPNGAGKSSILDSIRTGITGSCRGVDRKDVATLSRIGGKGFRVELEVDMGEAAGTFRRTPTTLSLVRDGRNVALKQESLDAALGHRNAVDALFDASGFLALDPAARKALVFAGANIQVTQEALRGAGLDLAGPDGDEIRACALAGDWKKAERLAAEAKRSCRRTAAEFGPTSVVDPDLREPDPDKRNYWRPPSGAYLASAVTDDDLRDVRDRLQALEVREEELRVALAEAAAQTKVSSEAKAAEMEKLRGYVVELEKVEAQVKGALEEAERERDAVRAGVEECRQELNVAGSAVRARVAEHAALVQASTEHKCPTCRLPHTSGTVPDPKAIHAIADEVERLKQEEEVATETYESGKACLADFEALVLDHAAKKTAFEKAQEKLARVKARIEALEAPDPDPIDTDALVADLTGVREERDQGRQIIETVRDYRGKVAIEEVAKKQKAKLLADATEFERIEKLCRPDGLQTKFLAPALGPIRKTFEWWRGGLLGQIPVDLEITDDLEVFAGGVPIERKGGEWRGLLSKGQHMLLSIALADCLSRLARLRWLVIDDLNHLDGENRALLVSVLLELAPHYDQILVAAAQGDDPPRPSPCSDLTVYHVVSGTVTRLEDPDLLEEERDDVTDDLEVLEDLPY